MSEVDIDQLLAEAMQAVALGRKHLSTQGMTDLRRAAGLVEACHTALREAGPEVAEKYQTKLVGLLDEVEQLTSELVAEDQKIRADMQSLNSATQAQRAYRGG